MDFEHPQRLLGLLAVPVLALIWLAGSRRRARERQAYGLPGLGSSRTLWSLLGLVFLGIAIAQPRWGLADVPPPVPGHDLILAIDVSRSMAAEDCVPDRLGIAAGAARSLLKSLRETPGERVGLVLFAGRAVLRCPLTEYLDAIDEALQTLRPGQVSPGGSDLGAALNTAADAFGDRDERQDGRAIVVFSDGEAHQESWPDAVTRLMRLGIVVHTASIGDDVRGAPIPIGDGRWLEHEGERVITKRRDAPLKEIADETGGAFLPIGLSPAPDLGGLYRDRIAPAAKARRTAAVVPERVQRYAWPLLAGVACTLAAHRPGRGGAGFSRVVLVTALIAAPSIGANPGDSAPAAIGEGRMAYQGGDFSIALEAFERAIGLAPESPIPRFDAASTLFRLGRFEEADARYREARDRSESDPSLRARIDFARGNTALALGDVPAAIGHYDRCLESANDPALRDDAETNRRFAIDSMPPKPEREGDQGPDRHDEPRTEPAPRPDPPPDRPDAEPEQRPTPPGAEGGEARPNESPPPPPPLAPEERLQKAMERSRQSRKGRLEDPPAAPDPRRKDW
ncbi:MAG: VWA domain-containing protein [Isosphaeraceae bacterium]